MARTTLSALVLAAIAALATGCNSSPHIILAELPVPPPPADPVVLAPAPAADVAEATPTEPSPEPVAADASPSGWVPAVMEQVWQYIVIHHSATANGNAAQFDKIHRDQRGWDELGYHFVITNGDGGPDGNVQIGPRWHKQKWGAHCGGTPDNLYNDVGIGICLVGDFDDHMPSDEQLASLVQLVQFLMTRYEIRTDDIIGHTDAPNAATACPGGQLHTWIADHLAERLGLRTSKTNSPDTPAGSEHPES